MPVPEFRFFNQLLWGLIHAYSRMLWVERTLIDIQHHFHVRNKVAILFRRYYPAFALPRLKFIFFKMRRTVSWDMLSM